MSLIVEDGSGLIDAESYASVAYADVYHYNRGNTEWAGLDTSVKEQNLRKGTEKMIQDLRSSWKGYKVVDTQGVDFPREAVYIDTNVLVANNIVPKEVMNACCEYAYKAREGALTEDTGGKFTTKEKVDVIEVEYSETVGTNQSVVYESINNMLKPYLLTGSVGGISSSVDRG